MEAISVQVCVHNSIRCTVSHLQDVWSWRSSRLHLVGFARNIVSTKILFRRNRIVPGNVSLDMTTKTLAQAFVEAEGDALPSVAVPKMLKLIGIAGSFRKASTHLGLLRASAAIIKEEMPNVNFEMLEISHLPYVNTDLEVDKSFPDSVLEFRAKILQADGVLFTCPEYNFSIPGVLKNAIDWASRPPNAWGDKPAAIITAGGGFGGGLAAYHLRQVGVYLDIHWLNHPLLHIKAFDAPLKFDKDGNLVDEATRVRLKSVLHALRTWTIRLQKP